MTGTSVVSRGSLFALEQPQLFASSVTNFLEEAALMNHGPAQALFDQLCRMVSGVGSQAADEQHRTICGFLACLEEVAHRAVPNAATHLFVVKSREYNAYLDAKAIELKANPREGWLASGVRCDNNAVLAKVIDEIASHVRAFGQAAHRYESMTAYAQAKIDAMLPREIAGMRQEANLGLVLPFLEQAFSVPGDVAEFGCFRGVLAVKLAWLLKAAGIQKRYYAFDTFHGFEIADPQAGALGVGAFRDDAFDAYKFLTQWSHVLPLTPVKGDATQTCRVLKDPLSFVWLDLDMNVLMDPVLRQIWPLCGPDSLIGVDDVGRPETPSVAPWLDGLIDAGVVEVIFDSEEVAPNTFIKVVKKKGPYPQAGLSPAIRVR